VGANGALQAEPGGIVPDDPTLANPINLLLESKGKFLYVANQGNNTTGANANSGLSGYFLTTSPAYQLSFIAGEPFGSGSVRSASSRILPTSSFTRRTSTIPA